MSVLLDPTILASIKDLSLAARMTIDGFMTGLHQSRVKGPGLEFSQYRSYQPGDDLRWLDWKMYARSDRYYIRESEIETSISVRFILDASRSMDHSDGTRSMDHPDGTLSKIQYARYLAACLGYLAYLQGDAIGLSVVSGEAIQNLSSRRDAAQLSRFIYQLEHAQPSGRFPNRTLFADEAAPKKSLFVFISDLYEHQGEITRLLETLSALGNEVIVLHLMGAGELDMDFGAYTTLEDLETGERLPFHPRDQAETYRLNLETHLGTLRTRLHEKRIAYHLLTLRQAPAEALRAVLRARAQMDRKT